MTTHNSGADKCSASGRLVPRHQPLPRLSRPLVMCLDHFSSKRESPTRSMTHERRPVLALSPAAGSSKDPLAARIIGSATSGIFELGIFHPVGRYVPTPSLHLRVSLNKRGANIRTPEGLPASFPSPRHTQWQCSTSTTLRAVRHVLFARVTPRTVRDHRRLHSRITSTVWVECGVWEELPTRNTTHPLFQPPTPPPTPGIHPHTSAHDSPSPPPLLPLSSSPPPPPSSLPTAPLTPLTPLTQTPSRSG